MEETVDDDVDDDDDDIEGELGTRVPANQTISTSASAVCFVVVVVSISATTSLGNQGDGSDSPLLGDDVVGETEIIEAARRQQPSADGAPSPSVAPWRQNSPATASLSSSPSPSARLVSVRRSRFRF